ncbi:MAG: hypothetical protein IJ532_03870 [Alphaproteobacteria bacterium]|nr:hypothetical protein [Alphaproteobacteria bacterium]
MDKQKLRSEVLATVNEILCDAGDEQRQTDKFQVSEDDVISDLELESLEMIAMVEVLEQKFNLGYIEVSTVKNLTVGQLCDKVVYRNLRQEVKKDLLKLLQKLNRQNKLSDVNDEERIFWNIGYDSIDIQDLTQEIEQKFGVDLTGYYLGDYTFGEVIDFITEHL